MGAGDEALTGFSTHKSPENMKSEILIWSDVFLLTKDDGEKLAIILAEVQESLNDEVVNHK